MKKIISCRLDEKVLAQIQFLKHFLKVDNTTTVLSEAVLEGDLNCFVQISGRDWLKEAERGIILLQIKCINFIS